MMGPTEPVVSGVIAYNGDSQRGWNDPPTLAFTATKKGPKLDLRKRVSHQEALTGRKITSPSYPSPTTNPTNQVTKGLSSIVLRQQAYPPDQSPVLSPCHSRHSSGSFTPPLIPENQISSSSTQVPSPYPTYPSAQPLLPPPTMATVLSPAIQAPISTTPPPPSSSPVSTTVPSSIGKPLFSPKCLNMAPVSSVLNTSHVRANPDILLDTLNQADNSADLDSLQNPLLTFPNKDLTSPLIYNALPPTSNNFDNIPGTTTHGLNRSCSAPRLHTPPTGGGRHSPVAPPPAGSPVSTPARAHSGPNTPRSNSPVTYTSNGTVVSNNDKSEDFDSEEAMKVSVEALEEIILKCNSILKSREVEDVKKKLGIMKQQWKDDKLSISVQKSMKLLAKALQENDTQTSHKLHVQIMVDYVGEVKQWMVAIKRLISAVGNLQG